MAPFFNTKSIALFVIFFLAVASSEASKGINPSSATTTSGAAAMTDIHDLLSTAILGQNTPLRDYNPKGDLNRTMNITVQCLQSILDFMICMDYFQDPTIPAPPQICCDGYMALSKSPPCVCQLVYSGWNREFQLYLPHVIDAPTLCGLKRSETPFDGCDAYMPHPTPSPAPAPAAASRATSPSPATSP